MINDDCDDNNRYSLLLVENNLQFIGGLDVFEVSNPILNSSLFVFFKTNVTKLQGKARREAKPHLCLVRLVRQLLHLLLDCVHPDK